MEVYSIIPALTGVIYLRDDSSQCCFLEPWVRLRARLVIKGNNV